LLERWGHHEYYGIEENAWDSPNDREESDAGLDMDRAGTDGS